MCIGRTVFRNILTLCTGNICRSPLAAALLRQRLTAAGRTGVQVQSAGIGALVAVMKRIGLRGDLALCGLSDRVARNFSVTRMDRVFPILTPLAVARQMEREAHARGYDARVIRDQSEARAGINICNYDRLD